MANSRVFFQNIATADAFTITVTTEAASFEKENALDSSPKNTSRSTNKVNQYYTLNGTVARQIFGVALHNVNTLPGDTLQLQTSNNDFAATIDTVNLTTVTRTVYEVTNGILTPTTYTDAYGLSNSNHQDYRIFMNNAAGTYTEIGKIYLFGGDYTFGKDYNWGGNEGVENHHSGNRGSFGLLTRNFKYQGRIWQFSFPGINFTQKDLLMNQIGAEPFIVWLPDGIGKSMYLSTMIVQLPGFVFTDAYELTCTVEEAL